MRLQTFLLLLTSSLPSTILARIWTTNDPCPSSIKTTVPGGSWERASVPNPPNFPTMESVHSALSTCPNITSLDLRVTLLGCSEWPSRYNFPFSLSGREKYPPLKELKLDGYDFSERAFETMGFRGMYGGFPLYERVLSWFSSGKARDWWKYRKLPVEQRNKTNGELWMDAMDWSQIETLALDDCVVPMDIIPKLTSLRELDFQAGDAETAMAFIAALPNNSLTHLKSLERLPLLPILKQQGASLQSLDLRTEEVMTRPSKMYNTTELTVLGELAPNLAHLSINLARNGTWPLETLNAISSLSSLKNLHLWLDLTSPCQRQAPTMRYTREWSDWLSNNEECSGENQYQKPFVSEDASLELFKYMRARKAGQELSNVTFWVGDWMRPWDGPLYFPDWLEGKAAKVGCSVEGKMEGEAWCVAEVSKDYWKDGVLQDLD